MTPQTPPTDRPLTAGDVPLLREGDLIKGPNGKTYRFEEWGDGGFLTFIDEPYDGFLATLCNFLACPATSAASEEAPTYADELVNASMRRRDADFGREEAPAEGAGEGAQADPLTWAITWARLIAEGNAASPSEAATTCLRYLLALRNRTSEPEAGAVRRTMTINLSETEVAALEDLIAKKELDGPKIFRNSFRLYQAVEMGAASVTWPESGPLGLPITHPAPATADKLKVAVEAMRGVIEWDKKTGYRIPYRVRDPLYAAIDLAALNEQPQ